MEFLKLKRLIKSHKPNPEKDSGAQKPNREKDLDNKPLLEEPEPKKENGDESVEVDEDDDDFIMNEVKRRLKELKRNSFMVLIPEETCPEEDDDDDEVEVDLEEGEASSNEWRDVEAEGRQLWSCFGAFYDKYCERMLFFDRLTTQLLKQIGSHNPSTPSPRSLSKKLRSLSLKKTENDDAEQIENDPYLDLEAAYVSQLCLTWEALHCQYSQLLVTCHSQNSKCYNQSAHQFQQFQVLLQRFIENEPFERGLRPEIYAHTRISFSKLMQVPNISGEDRKDEESDTVVHASDLIKIIESSILTFQLFVKMDKKKSNGGVRNLFGGQNQMVTPLQQVQSSLDKKKVKLKELWKKRKGGKKNQWPGTNDEVELLLGLIDVKVISRVLRMVKISKEQLFWSEEKMKKLDVASGKFQRDPSPVLFPC